MDLDSESKLLSLISQFLHWSDNVDPDEAPFSLIISLLSTMDLDSQPKPQSQFMSLVIQTISFFNSMDLASQPKPLSEYISCFIEFLNPTTKDSESNSDSDEDALESLYQEVCDLEPEPEFMSLIYQTLSLVNDMNSKDNNLIFLCPQVYLKVEVDDVHFTFEDAEVKKSTKWECLFAMKSRNNVRLVREEGWSSSYVVCGDCKGENHEGYEKVPVKIKHPLHPKHSLTLATLVKDDYTGDRKCNCCDKDLSRFIYCCLTCHFAINMACVKKPPVLSIDHSKWHEHPLALFSRTTSLICDVCALVDSTSAIYICPPCGFVVHGRCFDLPRVIRISRHPHRISFTPSFNQGSLSCGVCRRNIENDYGGYSCIKEGCSYAAHSRCATQRNVWDGIELEGVPEDDVEEELEPFVRISDGIIKYFSHQEHHLELNNDADKDYDENKQCQACTTPIYSGNFYSCLQCEFILHEECAYLSRKIHHPVHPHMLILVGGCDSVGEYSQSLCSLCPWICTTGFFYKCDKEGCNFKVHVQCGVISEPLVHGSHIHPLYLTSKPGEARVCSIGNPRVDKCRNETFNCIECEFSLCFGCATIPQKLRYKHDKHMLTLSYGMETSTTTMSWCEVCERKIHSQRRFYMCDEDCCVTLHMECVIGKDLYTKRGSSWFYEGKKVDVMANNLHMSRPFCSRCGQRCTQKIVLKVSGFLFCSQWCVRFFLN